MTQLINFWRDYLGLWTTFGLMHLCCIRYCIELLEPRFKRDQTFFCWFAAAMLFNTVICAIFAKDIGAAGAMSFGIYIVSVIVLFRDSFFKKLAAIATLFLSQLIEEVLIYMIIVWAYGNPYSYESMSSYGTIILFGIPIILACLSLFVLLWRGFFKTASKTVSNERIGMLFVLSAQWTLFLLVGGIMLKYQVLPYSVVIISLTAMTISLGGVVWLVISARNAIRRREESDLILKKLSLCEERQRERDEQFETLRRIKHDFRNHMQVLSGLANEGKLDEIYSYTDELLEDYR